MEARAGDLEAPEGVGETSVSQLAFRYGHAARAVLDVAWKDPKLARPIVEGRPDLLAEVVIAARLEQARSVADVLLRRTRLGLLAAPQLRGTEVARRVADVMGAELGWSRRQVKREAEAWPLAAAEAGIDPADGRSAREGAHEYSPRQ
jgi:glycerol-3-phosphate dehydrogenase